MWSVVTLILINGMTVQIDRIPNIQYQTLAECVHERTIEAKKIGKRTTVMPESNGVMFKDDSRKYNIHLCIENPSPALAQQEVTENLKISGFQVIDRKGKKQ